jgi:hypothetical protein
VVCTLEAGSLSCPTGSVHLYGSPMPAFGALSLLTWQHEVSACTTDEDHFKFSRSIATPTTMLPNRDLSVTIPRQRILRLSELVMGHGERPAGVRLSGCLSGALTDPVSRCLPPSWGTCQAVSLRGIPHLVIEGCLPNLRQKMLLPSIDLGIR